MLIISLLHQCYFKNYLVESCACLGGGVAGERKCCVLAECLHKGYSYFCQNVLAVLLELKHFFQEIHHPTKIAELALTLQPLFHLMHAGCKWKIFLTGNILLNVFFMMLLWNEHVNHVQDPE